MEKTVKEGAPKGARSFEFAKGGSTKMFSKGQDGAGRANPAAEGTSGPGTSGGGDWAKGGSGHMFGYQSADEATPGQTAVTKG